MKTKYEYLLFDLDGTITDSYLAVTTSFKYALKCFGIEVGDGEDLSFVIGPPLRDSFMTHFKMTFEQAEKATEKYRERYGKCFLDEHRIYPGIEKVLSQLKEAGYKLLVATSKPEDYSRQILDKFNLSSYFYGIYGATHDGTRDSKMQILDYIFKSVNIHSKEKCIMIGDTRFDMEGARLMGVDAMAVLYGFGRYDELAPYKPVYMAETVEDIYNFFEKGK